MNMMKLLSLAVSILMCMAANAQIIHIYKGDVLLKVYSVSEADRVVFPAINHEYVDLGLSVKWATCNVGAVNCYDYGDYFAWGETEPYSTFGKPAFNWSTYKYAVESEKEWKVTKYCTSTSNGTVDNLTTLEAEDDAAHVNWDGSWRIPTDAELTELRTKCSWTWTNQSGVKGYKITGPNGNTIFLPAGGSHEEEYQANFGISGSYWSSSLNIQNSHHAYYLYFDSHDVERNDNGDRRYYGCSIRPVCP